MKYLVFCPCGHSLELHAGEGCCGTGNYPCSCRRDQVDALNAAIERVRDEAVGWHPEKSSAEGA